MRTLRRCVLFLVVSSSAFAHAFLDDAMPPVGSVITAAPHELRLAFTEPLDLAQCSIKLQDQRGAPVALGAIAFATGNNTLLVATIQAPLSA
ncbi:MAG: copper resistance protein CopC, partial [Alphaproteobacteria bacterium]